MSDLAKRLRNEDANPTGMRVMLEAADRIERLETENYRLTRMAEARAQQPDWEKLWAESEAKIERLEVALAELVDVEDCVEVGTDWKARLNRALRKARATLKETGE